MFKKIKISNFHSIGHEQEFSMEITSKDILNESARKMKDGTALNLVSCISGHNAAGKTTVLKAISFIFWFVNNSYMRLKSDDRIPCASHALQKEKPSKIEIEFLNEYVLYKYAITFDKNEIFEESLHRKNQRMTLVFKLNRTKKHTSIKTRQDLIINEMDKKRFESLKNIPLLACLINTGYLPDLQFFKKFSTNVSQLGRVENNTLSEFIRVADKLKNDQLMREALLNFNKKIDLDISGFEFSDATMRQENDPSKEKNFTMLLYEHTTKKHKKFTLPFFEESDGTLGYTLLFLEIFPILAGEGLIVIDEIENSLHPDVVRKIISLFENKETNPHNTQLIFSTHQHILLNDRTKTQIFLVEKNKEFLEADIYRLDNVEGIRNDENFFQKYISGAYGGTPNIKWM